MPAPKKAYVVSLPDFVVFAEDEIGAVEEAVDIVAEGALSLKRLTPEQLRREFGSMFPTGDYDPDRELTCAEIADEMERAAGEQKPAEPSE